MQKIILHITFVSLILYTAFSCNKNSIIPPEDDQPGRRDYVWTIDTLDINSPVYKIWGSSPTDVWSINESNNYVSIWHYDGNRWSTDGIFRFILPHAIYGFSYNDVYIGGTDGKIWKYNGSSWDQFAELTKEGTKFIYWGDIWGESSNDIYAVGSGPDDKGYFNQSAIAHYSNNRWNMINTDPIKGFVTHLYKNKTDQKTYLQVSKIGGTEFIDSTIIYEYTGEKYKRVYSSLEVHGLQTDISLINGQVYFILGNEIAKRIDNQFQTIININNPNFYQRIWGRNSKDIFLLMIDGLAHYNGTDIEYLFHFSQPDVTPWTQIYGAALFDNDVFFTVYEPPTYLKLIYHGKLKE